jgi:hypothetical protein
MMSYYKCDAVDEVTIPKAMLGDPAKFRIDSRHEVSG